MAALRFTLLGPFAATRDGVDVTPSAPERRAVLAALVLERGRAVDAAQLAAAVWPGKRALDPASALRPHVDALQVLLGSASKVRFAIAATGGGWRLELPDPCTDLDDLDILERSALEHLTLGEDGPAAEDLRAALRLRTGPVLAGLPGAWFAPRRSAVQARVDGVAARLAGALAQNPTLAAATELRALSAQHPRNPAVWLRRVLVEEQVADADAAFLVYQEAVRLLPDRPGTPEAAQLQAAGARLAPAPAPAPTGLRPSRDSSVFTVALLNDVTLVAPRSRPVGERLDPVLRAACGLTVDSASPLRFEVLRRPGVVVGRRRVPFVRRSHQAVLAALLLADGGPVLTADLVKRSGLTVTGDPQGAVHRALVTLVWQASQLIGREELIVLHTRHGWELPQARGHVDLDAVRAVAAAGRAALAAGRYDRAAPVLRHALDRVPAVPFPGLDGAWFRVRRAGLVAWRTALEADCVRAEQGRAAALAAAEATGRAVRADPLREDLWAEHLHALVRAGRADNALRGYADVEQRLGRTLSTTPGPTLQMLRARIEADDPELYLP